MNMFNSLIEIFRSNTFNSIVEIKFNSLVPIRKNNMSIDICPRDYVITVANEIKITERNLATFSTQDLNDVYILRIVIKQGLRFKIVTLSRNKTLF